MQLQLLLCLFSSHEWSESNQPYYFLIKRSCSCKYTFMRWFKKKFAQRSKFLQNTIKYIFVRKRLIKPLFQKSIPTCTICIIYILALVYILYISYVLTTCYMSCTNEIYHPQAEFLYGFKHWVIGSRGCYLQIICPLLPTLPYKE